MSLRAPERKSKSLSIIRPPACGRTLADEDVRHTWCPSSDSFGDDRGRLALGA